VTDTESQKGGWNGPPEVIWSNLPAQAGSPKASCPGPCPDGFWICLRMETIWPLWTNCSCA